MSAIFTSFSHTHHGVNALILGLLSTATRQIQCGKCLRAKQRTANSAWQAWRKWCLQAKQCAAALQIQHGDNGAVFGRRLLSLSLSLSRCSHLWHAFALNLKGFFTHFVVVSSRFILDFAHFIAISSHLIVNFSYFIIAFSRLYCSCFSLYHSFSLTKGIF